MNSTSFTENLEYNDAKVAIKVLLETSFSKEIRILFKKGQVMKEHKAPFPIIVHILEGEIAFGVEGNVRNLKKGAMLTLEGNIPHDLSAIADSMVRLTLSKQDTADRVKDVVAHS
jgi:quercetin dioxygenase-like cupin family protein